MAQNANEYKLFGLFYVNYIVSYFFCNQSFKIDTLIPPNGEKIRKNLYPLYPLNGAIYAFFYFFIKIKL